MSASKRMPYWGSWQERRFSPDISPEAFAEGTQHILNKPKASACRVPRSIRQLQTSTLVNRAPRDAKFIQQFQVPPKFCSCDFTTQQLTVLIERPFQLPGCFVQEF